MTQPDPDGINANVLLADGSRTRPDKPLLNEEFGLFKAALRTLSALFPDQDPAATTVVDLGCLEGGYTFGFARAGYQALGIEARQINVVKCEWIRNRAGLANVRFVLDDARNLARYGTFDVVFCSGLLYHLDDPVEFLRIVAPCTRRALILHTHYSTPDMPPDVVERFALSEQSVQEGVPGRYYTEYDSSWTPEQIQRSIWASWGNARSFWLDRRHLLQTLRDIGFDAVYEQFDFLDDVVTDPYIEEQSRSMFVAVKTDRATGSG